MMESQTNIRDQKRYPQTRRGMAKFVVIIFLIAIVIAGIYLLGFTPGEA